MYGLTSFEQIAIWSVLVTAIIGLLYAIFLRSQILKEDMGTPKMQEVWGAIRDGADTYLRRQLKSIIPLILVLTVALFASVFIVPPTPEASEWYCGVFKGLPIEQAKVCSKSLSPADSQQVRLIIGIGRAFAFVLGATFSLMVGQIGMRMAVQGNVRVASASRRSFGDALRIAYRTGTITGMLTDGLGLFGGTLIFIIFGISAPDALLGFGFGGTLLALFMRVGGGIFTKAADVGADLVGKVEAGIPEDDPRNPAVIADLVGDNVGDCAGMAADIFESYEVTIVSGLILGLALMAYDRSSGVDHLSINCARYWRFVIHHRHLCRARRARQERRCHESHLQRIPFLSSDLCRPFCDCWLRLSALDAQRFRHRFITWRLVANSNGCYDWCIAGDPD